MRRSIARGIGEVHASMNFEILETARHELDEAITYYNRQQPELGDAFLFEVLAAIDRIRAFPEAWPQLSRRTRRCRTKRFPYGVAYQPSEDSILIVAISHLHRDPSRWQDL